MKDTSKMKSISDQEPEFTRMGHITKVISKMEFITEKAF